MLGPNACRLFRKHFDNSLNRKFLIGREILPFSIRNVPSRVSPVLRTVRGSTGQMY